MASSSLCIYRTLDGRSKCSGISDSSHSNTLIALVAMAWCTADVINSSIILMWPHVISVAAACSFYTVSRHAVCFVVLDLFVYSSSGQIDVVRTLYDMIEVYEIKVYDGSELLMHRLDARSCW